jgi:DNA (cytosine-5)-methyltransferase 1
MRPLTHLSLFSGIGGLDLAAEAAGFVTVGQCEWADYPTKILEKHWPDVPRWRDIRTLTGESFYERTGLRTVDIVSGGFPCQPFSCAGKRRGAEDDRYLWPEMCRVIRELRPTWVLGENVPGIVNLALDTVLADLEKEGYESQCFLVPACGVDAPHKRNRIAILAHGESARNRRLPIFQRKPQQKVFDVDWQSKAVPNATRWREQRIFSERPETRGSGGGDWWAVEPDVGRVAYGIPNRVDRIKCLGNAVVPQQFYPFFAAIAEIERRSDE